MKQHTTTTAQLEPGLSNPGPQSLRAGGSSILRDKVVLDNFWRNVLGAAALLSFASMLGAQGILTVTPGRTVATGAAPVNEPQGVAYDGVGNLYIADSEGEVVREVSASGVVTVVAGTGVEGYSGDGGVATSAMLDTPTGVALDVQGNIYIADSHNHCVREVIAGTIKTIAGTGKPGFAGDGGVATAAQLWLPRAVAVDGSGTVYIADTGNQRIRTITGSTINTIAGDGEELFAGDGGVPTAAVLDSPTGIAVDSGGSVYIADRHNQRIRKISGNTISTLAGGGASSFAGGFYGDGGAPANALLSRPSGVSVDGSGNIYIADTGNQRIRELGGGAIATVAGSGQQGFGADGNTPATMNLSAPKAVATDVAGNLAISDTMNASVRAASLPTLSYAPLGVGIPSPAQPVTLTNSGSAAIVINSMNLTGPFNVVSGGSCTNVPLSIAVNASCTENISYLPTVMGAVSGSVVFSGAGVVPQTVLLAGSGVRSATTLILTSNTFTALVGEPMTFSAVVQPAGSGIPTGTVSFFDGATQIGTAQPLVNGTAALTTTMAAPGMQNVSAVYSGAATTFLGSKSGVMNADWVDFTLSTATASAGGPIQAVSAGASATYNFNLTQLGGTFTLPVTLSATGLPAGASVTFTPKSLPAGSMPGTFTMTVQTSLASAKFSVSGTGLGGNTLALGLLLLPLIRRRHGKGGRLASQWRVALLLAGLIAMGNMTGCGLTDVHKAVQTYTISVIGTATGNSGLVLQHSIPVTLAVE